MFCLLVSSRFDSIDSLQRNVLVCLRRNVVQWAPRRQLMEGCWCYWRRWDSSGGQVWWDQSTRWSVSEPFILFTRYLLLWRACWATANGSTGTEARRKARAADRQPNQRNQTELRARYVQLEWNWIGNRSTHGWRWKATWRLISYCDYLQKQSINNDHYLSI